MSIPSQTSNYPDRGRNRLLTKGGKQRQGSPEPNVIIIAIRNPHKKNTTSIHNRNAHEHGNLTNIHPVAASQPAPCISVIDQQQQQPGGQRQSGRG
ncbi:hypothetical protein B0T18DRAFT_410638 [Schizothecium vesticola]|uniref:Uncharacterized protein n=1 Tax=Schizothecium vesticola TaxID=314040 RepID=A0AA40EV34_9PEZI|nr:hypothetical protein B0T18DRAFT_410638 [Schizothecium vesticola]